MRPTLAPLLIATVALLAGAPLQAARSAEAGAAPPARASAREAKAEADRLKAEAEARERADKRRQERTERLSNSVCVGCGGPVVPFDPSGGEAARKAGGADKAAGVRAARSGRTRTRR